MNSSATMDQTTKAEIRSDMMRVEEIIDSGIFEPHGFGNPLLQSAMTELVIRVRDLLAKADKFSSRVSFTDDVTIKGKVTDVTGLITFVRDAVCHIDSGKHNHDETQARISFNTVFGKACLAQIGGVRIESMYADDIAFFFGPQRLYLKRHLMRAYNEAIAGLKPLL